MVSQDTFQDAKLPQVPEADEPHHSLPLMLEIPHGHRYLIPRNYVVCMLRPCRIYSMNSLKSVRDLLTFRHLLYLASRPGLAA